MNRGIPLFNTKNLPLQLGLTEIEYSSMNFISKNKSREFPFTLEELESFDDLIERILQKVNEQKQLLTKKINGSYEKIKQKFIVLLDSVYDKLYDLANNHSKYSVFDSFISNFQDVKSEFELNDNLQKRAELITSIENLYLLENSSKFKSQIDKENIRNLLITAEKKFDFLHFKEIKLQDSKFKNLLNSLKHDYEEIKSSLDYLRLEKTFSYKLSPSKLYTNKINSSNFTPIKINKQKTQNDSFISIESDYSDEKDTEKMNLKDNCFLMGNSDARQILKKLIEQRQYLRKKSDLSRYQVLKILNQKLNLTAPNNHKCYLLGNKLVMFESVQTIDELDEKTGNLKSLTSLSLQKVYNLTNLKDLSLKSFYGHISECYISPSKNYIGINRSNAYSSLVYSIKEEKLLEIESLKPYKMAQVAFVDYLDGEKLVFISKNNYLNVFDLNREKICSKNKIENLKSFHYVDSEHILYLTKDFEIGIYSLTYNLIGNRLCLLNPLKINTNKIELWKPQSRVLNDFLEKYKYLISKKNNFLEEQIYDIRYLFQKINKEKKHTITTSYIDKFDFLCLKIFFKSTCETFLYYLKWKKNINNEPKINLSIEKINSQMVLQIKSKIFVFDGLFFIIDYKKIDNSKHHYNNNIKMYLTLMDHRQLNDDSIHCKQIKVKELPFDDSPQFSYYNEKFKNYLRSKDQISFHEIFFHFDLKLNILIRYKNEWKKI